MYDQWQKIKDLLDVIFYYTKKIGIELKIYEHKEEIKEYLNENEDRY